MSKLVGLGVAVLALLVIGVAPVSAAARANVHLEVTTTFDAVPDEFVADGIESCTSGTVTDAGGKAIFLRPQGVFVGYKAFDCGGGTGFVVRLNARFGDSGSIGTWAIVDAWGDLAGTQGGGTLVGYPIGGGILDVYDGAFTS